MLKHISIRAGAKAMRIIKDEGLILSRVKVLAGASGSAKFLVLTGIDRVLAGLFKDRIEPLYLIGTSIGAFRMAAFCQADPISAINTLEQEYIAQTYSTKPSRQDLTCETHRILDAYIDDTQIESMLEHPFMKISFLSNRCRGVMKSENKMLQLIGMGLAVGVNRLNRNWLGYFFERALFHTPNALPPFAGMNQFPIQRYPLTPANFKQALISSGAIPLIMEGITDINGISGVFRDGGILDYHLDLPFLPDDDHLVLYPHFYETITPGWFDKHLNRRPMEKNIENVVLISPSPHFVNDLPFKKIPDRNDFYTFRGKDQERQGYWKVAVKKSRILADEFLTAVLSGRIQDMVRPL
jgi:hypothetical protein